MVNNDNCSFIYGNAAGAFDTLFETNATQTPGILSKAIHRILLLVHG